MGRRDREGSSVRGNVRNGIEGWKTFSPAQASEKRAVGAEALGGAEPVRIEPTGRPDRGSEGLGRAGEAVRDVAGAERAGPRRPACG